MRPFGLLTIACAAVALAGCARLLPGPASQPPDTFDLGGPAALAGPLPVAAPAAPRRQVLVVEPFALKLLDSEQIVVRTSPSTVEYLANAQWNDRLPRIVQAGLVQALEDSGRIGGVGKPGDGLAIDYRIITTIRSFEVTTVGGTAAIVDISAKLLDDRNGVVRAQRVFRAVAPVSDRGNAAFVAAMERAFDRVAGWVVAWTLANI